MAEAVPPECSASTRHLLRRRDFAVYWWSGIVSGTGTWLHNVTASVLMLTLTGSPLMVGLVNFATFVPMLLLSLPAGSLGDRVDRRRLVGLAQACAGVIAVGLTVLSALGRVTPWVLVVACFLLGSFAALTKPALSAILPALVARAEVARATALNVLQFQFGQIAGPALAAIILLTATPTWAFGLNAVSFAAPVVAMVLLRIPRSANAPTAAGRREKLIAQGIRFVRRTPMMPAILLAVVLSNGAVEALRTLAPILAADHAEPAAAGIVIMGYSTGAFLGLLGVGWMERRLAREWALAVAFGLQALGAASVALAPNLVLAVVGAAPIGVGFSLSIPLLSAALQNLSPDEFRGRVMAVFSMAHLGLRPLFALVAGGLATLVGTRYALASFVLLALGAAVFARRRRVSAA